MSGANDIKYYRDMLAGFSEFDFKNKKDAIALYVITMLNRTQRIFEYRGLPETIPARMLENYLQRFGSVCIAPYKDDLYCFFGGLGGEPDIYYQPTLYTISNPVVKGKSLELKIHEDCEIILNDSAYMGLVPLFRRYATALCENDISIDKVVKNMRAQFAIVAPDDRTLAAANKFLDDLESGESGAMLDKSFSDSGIQVNPLFSSQMHILQELTEYGQYMKASWFNEIGLNANFNMKRENISESESEMNFDALLPLIDDMLENRKNGIEKVNAMFGTNIEVSLSGVWAKTEQEMTEPEETETEDSGRPEESEEPEKGAEENEA